MRIKDKNNEGETIYLSPYLFLDVSIKTKQYLQLSNQVISKALADLSKTEKQSPCQNCNANYLQPNWYADLWEEEKEVLSEEEKEVLSEESDPVRPNHYKNCSIECIDAMILAFGADSVAEFCLINAFKYIWRYKDKNGIIKIPFFVLR